MTWWIDALAVIGGMLLIVVAVGCLSVEFHEWKRRRRRR